MSFIKDLRTMAKKGYIQSRGSAVLFGENNQPYGFCPIGAVAHLHGYKFDRTNVHIYDMATFLEKTCGYDLYTPLFDLPNPFYGPKALLDIVVELFDREHYDYEKIADYLEVNKLCR